MQPPPSHGGGSLFNTASHNSDTAMRLSGDHPAAWVQGHMTDDSMIDGDFLRDDPTGQGIIQFENGVTLYAALTGRGSEYQAICENGSVYIMDDGARIEMRVPGPSDHRGRSSLAPGQFPDDEPASAALNIVGDLVHSLDTGEPTRGGVRVARVGLELSFAIIYSHRRGGVRVEMRLEHRDLLLKRVHAPRQPRYRA